MQKRNLKAAEMMKNKFNNAKRAKIDTDNQSDTVKLDVM